MAFWHLNVDNIAALANIWFLGNNILHEWYPSFTALKNQAIKSKMPWPYLFAYYNVDVIYTKQLSDEKTLMGKMLNSLIKKLNEVKHLPRYIVIIFDKELIVDAQIFDFGAHETYEYALRWFVNNVARMIDTRKDDIRKKRLGARSPGSEPRFIWVKALSCPEVLLAKCVYSLICKFNASLEEVIVEE